MAHEILTERSAADTFELGLVMAGAVSAGAYTAGVVDFLIQALDAWEEVKSSGPKGPKHSVKLKVLSGASAGGMTAAITVAALASRFRPVEDIRAPDPSNKLFNSWVTRIDIRSLLGTRDLEDPGRPLMSLLDSSVLRSIADSALDVSAAATRPYVDDTLHILLTVANLRGVPYNIAFKGDTFAGHEMFLHADYMHFALGHGGACSNDGALMLDWTTSDPALKANWTTLKMAALATGAFPIGLAPCTLSRRLATHDDNPYASRKWPIPGIAPNCITYEGIRPHWSDAANTSFPTTYDFVAIDGGTLDNEPLELARRFLSGSTARNPRSADKAHRALVLIDPFPGGEGKLSGYGPKEDLVSVLPSLVGALLNQSRFKPDELMLAQRADVFSRFLVAPKRTPAAGPLQNCHLASGALSGFGGFLSQSFREHDFMLGRRNCQRFLSHHFMLASSNSLFDGWDPKARAHYRVEEDGVEYLPIIPLTDRLRAHEAIQPPWPTYDSAELARLRTQISARYDAVSERLVRQFLKNWLAQQLGKAVVRYERNHVIDAAMRVIEKDLTRCDLLTAS